MSVDRMHSSGFHFAAPGLVQKGDVTYEDNDEEIMFPWLWIGQSKKSKLRIYIWETEEFDPCAYGRKKS